LSIRRASHRSSQNSAMRALVFGWLGMKGIALAARPIRMSRKFRAIGKA